jgi:hypothetical protein
MPPITRPRPPRWRLHAARYSASCSNIRDAKIFTAALTALAVVIIEKAFGDFPLAALTDRRTRGVFMPGATRSPWSPGGDKPGALLGG